MARQWRHPGFALPFGDYDTFGGHLFHDPLATNRDRGSGWREAVRVFAGTKMSSFKMQTRLLQTTARWHLCSISGVVCAVRTLSIPNYVRQSYAFQFGW